MSSQELPKFIEGRDDDGSTESKEEEEVEVVEEEFDLSEIMAEEVEAPITKEEQLRKVGTQTGGRGVPECWPMTAGGVRWALPWIRVGWGRQLRHPGTGGVRWALPGLGIGKDL